MSIIQGLALDRPASTPKQKIPLAHGVSVSILEDRFPKPLHDLPLRATFSAPSLPSIPEEEEEFSEGPVPASEALQTEAKANQAFSKHHYRPS